MTMDSPIVAFIQTKFLPGEYRNYFNRTALEICDTSRKLLYRLIQPVMYLFLFGERFGEIEYLQLSLDQFLSVY